MFREFTDHPFLRNEPNLTAALARAQATGGPIFISGSLFLVAEAMRLLGASAETLKLLAADEIFVRFALADHAPASVFDENLGGART